MPVAVVTAADVELRARNAGGRLDEVLTEIERVRVEAGSPPLAAPIGHIVATQALVNVLGANRYGTIVDELRDLVSGRFGRTPGRSTRRSSGPSTCSASRPHEEPSISTRFARAPKGSPRAKRSCSCSRSSAPRPSVCCNRCASAPAARRRPAPAVSSRAGRTHPRRRADRPGHRDRRDHGRGGGHADQRPPHARASRRSRRSPRRRTGRDRARHAADPAAATGLQRVESPMVGTFYSAPGRG